MSALPHAASGQESSESRWSVSRSSVAALVTIVVATTVYWRTAFPTITWWDSSSYSLGAATLGIGSPPGSLLLTLIGWPVAHLATGAATARALNLLAGVLAATTVGLVTVVGATLVRVADDRPRDFNWLIAGSALGALALAWSDTLWTYAVAFTPYVLTPVFTALILLVLVRWWARADAPDARQSMAWLGLLFGVDFSVHRTNAVLIPGALVWILMRRPRTLGDRRAVVAGVGCMAAGLTLQLLLIPIAARGGSPLDFSHPSTLSGLWDYISLKQLGGSFLLQLFPRRSPFWGAQAADFARAIAANFVRWRTGFGLGVLPGIAVLMGAVVLWRRNRRFAAAYAALLLLQAALTVLYFNIPAGYFRTFDRHYLPVCVTLGVVAAAGAGAGLEWAARLVRHRRRAIAAAVIVATVVLPASQLVLDWRPHDASRRYFTRDYAVNALQQLPPHAVYFTVGDNDTFPLMYVQAVEGVRPDVTIINLSVANIPDWPDRLKRRDPSLPLSFTAGERQALAGRPWKDSIVVLPVHGDAAALGVSAATTLPDSIALRVVPAYGAKMLIAEVALLDIVRTNAWRRPLTFSVTGGESAMEWLSQYSRLDGLYYRIVPVRSAPADVELLRDNLIRRARYRGYADTTLSLDHESRMLGSLAYAGLTALLEAEGGVAMAGRCHADRDSLLVRLPLARVPAQGGLGDAILDACGRSAAK